MTATRKSIRFLTVIALIFAMIMSFAIPVFADGVETWDKGINPCSQFKFYGSNTSPIKTMGISGKLAVHATFMTCDPGGDFTESDQYLILQIRDLQGNILASDSITAGAFGLNAYLSASINVSQGQQIVIYVAAYRSGTLEKINGIVSYTAYLS